MERNDLSLEEWLVHLQEEMMDACVYLEKIKQEIQYQQFELAEKRMEIIGRNGNDGLHYDVKKGAGLHHTMNINGATVTSYPCSAHNTASEEYDELAQVRHGDSILDVDDETWACNTHPFQD